MPSAAAQHRGGGYRAEHLLTVATFVILSVGWTLFAGKDIGWDLFNHHLYMPFALLSGRYETDLFAAGPQSYLNPLGYLPFYVLARSGMPAWLVGIALAVLQAGLIVWALQRINHLVIGEGAGSRAWHLIALSLACVSPIFLYVVGTSSNDPLCAGLMLLALAVALDARATRPGAVLAGCALGLATAIKPTTAIFALPMLALVVGRTASRQWRPSIAIGFVLGTGISFALAGGLWAGWLWQEFGNPTFPLFNHIFKSPLAPAGTAAALRFLPQTGLDWLLRPWEMAQYKPFTMAEGIMPDLRPLLAVFALVAAVVMTSARHGAAIWLQSRTWLRPDVQLVLFLVVSYLLWLATSGNARYAIAWFMLIGIVLARAVQACWPARHAVLALVLVTGLQFFIHLGDGDQRTLAAPWDSGAYIPVTVPQRLVDEPFLHLSLGVQSHAGIAPYLHHGGAFANLTGQISLPADGPLGERLAQLLARWPGRTRFLFAPPVALNSPKLSTVIAAENWSLIRRHGLRIDDARCEVIRMMPAAPGSVIRGPVLLSCPAVREHRADPQLDRDLAQANKVFAALESGCPLVFGPSPLASDYGPDLIWRRYNNTDARIDVSKTKGVFVSHFRAANPLLLGTIEQVIADGGKIACEAWHKLSMK